MPRLQKKTVRRSLNIGMQLLFRTLFKTLHEDFYVNKCLIYIHYESFWIIPPPPPDFLSKLLIYIKISRRLGFDPLFGPLKGFLIINSVC